MRKKKLTMSIPHGLVEDIERMRNGSDHLPPERLLELYVQMQLYYKQYKKILADMDKMDWDEIEKYQFYKKHRWYYAHRKWDRLWKQKDRLHKQMFGLLTYCDGVPREFVGGIMGEGVDEIFEDFMRKYTPRIKGIVKDDNKK